MISVCGVYCHKECKAYNVECLGCNELEGKIPWACFYGKQVCPIYECVKKKGVKTCNDCSEVPCDIWYGTRNPSLSDEEFQKEIAFRIDNLGKF